MRPLHLEITGLRSFRAKQSLDFTDLSLFAVIGDTGAGKSSILEAIVFALYNASTWDARGGGALMSLDADAMTVIFDFSVTGKRYRVSRSVFRGSRPAIHALRSPDDPDYRFDGEQAVSGEIRRVLGLDWDTFKKTVVLPQGRFADLLNASETERGRVLGELLGLDEIDRLRSKLEPVRQEADLRLNETRAARGTFGEDPAAEAVRFEDEEGTVRARVAAMAAARTELRAKLVERVRLAERLSALVVVERESAAVFVAARAACDLLPEHDRLQAELGALAERRAQTQRDLDKADDDLKKLKAEHLDVASIVGLAGDITLLQSEREALASQAAEAEERERTLGAEHKALDGARHKRDEFRAKVAAGEAVLADAARRRDEVRERGERARDAWRAYAQASTLLKSVRHKSDELRAQRATAAGRLAAVGAALEETTSGYDLARANYEQVERADRAAALAHDLHAGEPCPLCRRELPIGFEAPAAPDVAAAKRACAKAERERDHARRDHERARAQLESLEAALLENESELAGGSQALDSAQTALLEAGLVPSSSNEDEALAPLRAEFVGADDALRDAQQSRDREKSKFDRTDAEVKAREKAQADAVKAHKVTARARAATLAKVESMRLRLPEAFRPSEAAEAAEFTRILGELRTARGHADEAAAKQIALTARAAQFEGGLRKLEREYQRAVSDAAASQCSAVDRSLAAQAAALRTCELSVAPVRLGDDFDSLVRWCRALLSWYEDTRPVAATRREEASSEISVLDVTVNAILGAHDVTTAEAFEQRYAIMTAQAAVAAERLAVARRQADRAAELDRRIAEFAPVVGALDQLHRYLQNRSFKDFVMRRRERRLLGIATEILRGMTGDQYAFAERFEILDGHTNRVRSARSLSGGETFLASLALALALVEVASRTGGKLDALFLDEGFGNLDSAALDDALSQLAERARSGKLIGVITHVRGIAEQIDTVLRVERRAGGSVIERLEGSELGAFMEDEVRTGLLGAAVSP